MKRTLALTGAAILVLVSGCTTSNPPKAAVQHASPVRRSAVGQLTGTQRHFGASITPEPGIVYQPGVVFVGGGADAVRSVRTDGVVWTLDAAAPGVSQLKVGSVLVVTTLAAGRVLALDRDGPDVRVVLGPIAITDLIRDADFGSAAPIPLSPLIVYGAPDLSAMVTDAAPDASEAPSLPASAHGTRSDSESELTGPGAGAAARAAAPIALGRPVALPPLPPSPLPIPDPGPRPVTQKHFTVKATCCTNGVGSTLSYDWHGVRLSAAVTIGGKPTLTHQLTISDGKIEAAEVALHGTDDIKIALAEASKQTSGDLSGQRITIPETITVPLTGLPIPLVLSITLEFYLKSQLLGQAALTAHGDYKVDGDLGFSFTGGRFVPDHVSFTPAVSMSQNTTSLGVAVNTITLGWGLKFAVGVGIPALSAGPWYRFDYVMSMAADANPMDLYHGCVTLGLKITGQYGVGVKIPKVLATGISTLLNLLGLASKMPAISDTGLQSTSKTLWGPPTSQYCPH